MSDDEKAKQLVAEACQLAGAYVVVDALHELERKGLIVRVEYKGAAWYELAPNIKERFCDDSE